MEIRDLTYFRTVVEAGGLTRAASVLHITPGALSKGLRRFEDEIGQLLFHRRGRALELTAAGELVYRRSSRLIEEHGRLVRELEESSTEQHQTLRIATFEVFSARALAAMLRSDGLQSRPFQMLDVPVVEIGEAVQRREVDLGLTYVAIPSADLDYEPVAEIGFGIYARRGAFEGAGPKDLPFVIPTTRLQLSSGELLGIDCWPYERVPRVVKYRVTLLETALAVAREGLAAVFIPHFIAGLHDEHLRPEHQLTKRRRPRGMKSVSRVVQLVRRRSEPAAIPHELREAIATTIRRGEQIARHR